MNLIDLEQRVKIVWGNKSKKHYIEKGYADRKNGEIFYPKLKDVRLNAHTYVVAVCDYCGEEYYPRYDQYNRHNSKIKTDCCSNCRMEKAQEYHNGTLNMRRKNNFDRLRRIMDENNYTLITKEEEYTGIYMEIKYICPKHGEVSGSLNKIINENNYCNECGNEKISRKLRLSSEEVEKIINSTNNILLNPSEYEGYNVKNLKIQCQCGRIYYASLTTFNNGKNQCGKCCASESRGEQKVRQWLENNRIDYIAEYIFPDCRDKKSLRFDFYLPSKNICIEYDGKQHSVLWKNKQNENAFKKIQYHDNIKNNYCNKNNIKLIRIPYTQYRHIDEVLDKELKIM